jgi:sugar lactone lactonase YvrE
VPLVVCDPGTEADMTRLLGPGYSVERIPLRAWWLMEHWPPGTLSTFEWLRTGADPDRFTATRPWAVVRYALTRLPWSAIGSTDVVVLRNTGEPAAVAARSAEVPAELNRSLGAVSARVLGEGWLSEPRGVALSGDTIAVADAGLSVVRLFDRDGHLAEPLDLRLLQPEAVAWTGDGSLVVADTWNHRVVLRDPVEGSSTVLAEPEGRWYGPRAVAVSPDGRLAVADTGNRRLILFGPALEAPRALDAVAAGGLAEPGGLAFVNPHQLVVCDTGNRRLLVLEVDGSVTAEVALPGAWPDYYSRPQLAVLSPSDWLVSDTPGGALWLVRDGSPERLDLRESGIQPTGLAWDGSSRTLVVADLAGAVWVFTLEGGKAAP